MDLDAYSISVVIPHHREESLLARSVQSALCQICQPLEIIVINDDDRPLSADLYGGLLATSAHLKIIELGRCSGGPAYPRNIAIAEAMGHYVAFLDADDFWLPNHLERMVDVWKRTPNAIVHCNQFCWGKSLKRPFVQKGLPTLKSSKSTFQHLLRSGNKIFLSSVGAPTELMQCYKFDLDLIWEDFDLWLRLAADGYQFINNNSCNTIYQIREGSRSGRRDARRQGSTELANKYFSGRPLFMLPPWLLRNLFF